jgi:hypothetical protein
VPLRTVWIPYWNGLWRMQNESGIVLVLVLCTTCHVTINILCQLLYYNQAINVVIG